MKTLIIIPAYNEELSIGNVSKEIMQAYPNASVLVVNDGSEDKTSMIAGKAGAKVINLPVNLGIGGAVQTGYRYAAQNDYDIAVQLDADGQHDPNDLEILLKPIICGEADFVLGSRFVEKGNYRAPITRRLGIVFFSIVVSIICGKTFKDTTSGYRAASKEIIKLFAHTYPTDYPEVESLVMLNREGFRIKEVAVSMRHRSTGRSSITPVRSVYYMVKVLLALLMSISRPKLGVKGDFKSGR
ncbi:MAG: glycosyltransferase family 2 protein [Peptococcaceae bacterium]|nr:glycosyltransferase family 2 protein [Peptococcaceae bacterium]